MSGPRLQRVYEQDLDDTEHAVAAALRDWLVANPNAEWKESRGLKNVEQCSEDGLRVLRNITRPLSTKPFKIIIFRTSYSGLILSEPGYLIPILPSPGCSVKDENASLALTYGRKIHIPGSANVSVEIPHGSLYILWLIKQ